MPNHDDTCGKELARGAIIPEQVAELFAHVAHNLRVHASWVGTDSPEATRENAAMIAVADGYESISAEAQRVCNMMRNLEHLPPAPHHPAALDQQALAEWMQAKVLLQRRLAKLLNEHADESERALRQGTV